jgi:hypothetical protein
MFWQLQYLSFFLENKPFPDRAIQSVFLNLEICLVAVAAVQLVHNKMGAFTYRRPLLYQRFD